MKGIIVFTLLLMFVNALPTPSTEEEKQNSLLSVDANPQSDLSNIERSIRFIFFKKIFIPFPFFITKTIAAPVAVTRTVVQEPIPQPVVTPIVQRTVVTQPVVHKTVIAQPVIQKTVVAEPVVAQPVYQKTVVAQPISYSYTPPAVSVVKSIPSVHVAAPFVNVDVGHTGTGKLVDVNVGK